MTYLIASAERRDLGAIQKTAPETWRRVRRYNLPVQLALAAAEEVIAAAGDPRRASVISLAPCQPGSADLYRWGDVVISGMTSGTLGDLRMNPTQTLHAVDNLAMSAFAITYGNQAECLGLGGAAGQAWCGLEAVMEKLSWSEKADTGANESAEEALLMAGDQDRTDESATGIGVALLFSRQAKTYAPLGRVVRLIRIERRAQPYISNIRPHASAGLCDFIAAIKEQKQGLLSYDVPIEQTDGICSVKIVVEIS
ncbi:MAG TPA: hypothetical protein VIF64_13740 [Pyrinomonadaceae bacterium]|jgi:hypothetical protein